MHEKIENFGTCFFANLIEQLALMEPINRMMNLQGSRKNLANTGDQDEYKKSFNK